MVIKLNTIHTLKPECKSVKSVWTASKIDCAVSYHSGMVALLTENARNKTLFLVLKAKFYFLYKIIERLKKQTPKNFRIALFTII